jgi:hypothetical protein
MKSKPAKRPFLPETLLPMSVWLPRMCKFILFALLALGLVLGIGIIGYHVLGGLSWVDSLLEASMILGGMGAIAPMINDAVKIFASIYALFSGFVALSSMAVIIGPWLHRLLHHLHAIPPDDNNDQS